MSENFLGMNMLS